MTVRHAKDNSLSDDLLGVWDLYSPKVLDGQLGDTERTDRMDADCTLAC